MADELQRTTEEFDAAILQLEEMGRIVSGLDKIGETIEYIGVVRKASNKNKKMVSELIDYIAKYKGYFDKKDVKWVFLIKEYYNNDVIRLHLDSFEEYLDAFEDLLRFSYRNFYQISEIEDPKFLKNYDAYYLRYGRASQRFSKYNLSRNEYQKEFVSSHPKIAAYLPGVRQTDVFDIQEKSPIIFF